MPASDSWLTESPCRLTNRELKSAMDVRGIGHKHCLERIELLQLRARVQQVYAAASAAYVKSFVRSVLCVCKCVSV